VRSGPHLTAIDVGPLVDPDAHGPGDAATAAAAIDRACRELGFFRITGHGLPADLQATLEACAEEFFALDDSEKAEIEMARAGAAWRGWFPVGGELTSGRPDRKEGLYVGAEHAVDHPRVRDGTPLHGPNLFGPHVALRGAVLAWLDALVPVAHAVMRGVAMGLGLEPDWFRAHLTDDPTVLFRIFHYPPHDPDDGIEWGVAEHTDYGLLTLLAQDRHGGLQVHGPDGWIDVPPEPGVLVCNLGDMLERLTHGRYRSTPHRVRNTTGEGRLSFPFFFDPSWDARVVPLPLDGSPHADQGRARWDGTDVLAWDGTYGDYLTAKVARVFPDLFAGVTGGAATPRWPSDVPPA
jgi:isopenicillin N synthase-like dioxygenase